MYRGTIGAAALAAGFLLFAWHGALAKDPPPIEAFASLPAMTSPLLSPDGKYFAAIQSVSNNAVIAIYDLTAAPGAPPIVVPTADWVASGIRWAKNDRLIVILRKFGMDPGGNRVSMARTIAVDHAGQKATALMRNLNTFNNNTSSADIVDIDLDDPTFIFAGLYMPHYVQQNTGSHISHDDSEHFEFDLMKVDVMTGDAQPFMAGTPFTQDWQMDGHGGVVGRVDQSKRPLLDHVQVYRGGQWSEMGSYDATADRGAAIASLSNDGKALVRFSRGTSEALTQRDLATGAETVLLSLPDYDVSAAISDDWSGRVIGARYVDDRTRSVYFDPAREALQQGLEKLFPNLSVNVLSTDVSGTKAIFETEGDRTPPTYYFLDRTTHKAELIGLAYPALTTDDLGKMRPYSYAARDGLRIPAYITLPPGRPAQNLPMVVMPHGGPDARDQIRFDWLGQFLANRGYVMLQPNFRGSFGYGRAFTEAGLRQWGLKMQDDITDGVKKAIADGIADPKRICIVGASYGGYAALAGAAFTPDLYACAASFAGVSNLPLMLAVEHKAGGANSSLTSFWASRIGTSFEDADRLKDTSPAFNADRVRCPILLMHGLDDSTVPIEQSESMQAALIKAGKNVEFIRVKSEDHYLTRAETRVRLLSELERFLAANIGK